MPNTTINISERSHSLPSGFVETPVMLADNRYYNDIPVSSAGYKCTFIRVAPGKQYRIAGTFNTYAHAAVYFDKFKKVLGWQAATTGTNTHDITTPAGCVYMACNTYGSAVTITTLEAVILYDSDILIPVLGDGFKAGFDLTTYYHCHYGTDVNSIQGYAINSSGLFEAIVSTTYASDFIPVIQGKTINIRAYTPANCYCATYNKLQQVIAVYGEVVGGLISESINTDGVHFIRISSLKTYGASIWYDEDVIYNTSYFKPFFGKKLVTYGDSISSNKIWQTWLCKLTGMIWSSVVNESGSGMHYELEDGTRLDANEAGAVVRPNSPTAISGTAVLNVYDNAQADWDNPVWTSGYERTSIPARMRDAKYYNPDVILIFAGANDFARHDDGVTVWGAITDEPYLADNFLVGGAGTSPTVYASFKGALQHLSEDCPNAKVVICSLMPWRFVDVATYNSYDPIQKAVNIMLKECAELYRFEYIDLYQLLGWNFWNNTANYNTPSGDREVHPNPVGQMKMAELLSKYL